MDEQYLTTMFLRNKNKNQLRPNKGSAMSSIC